MNPFWLIHIFQRGGVETTNYRQAPWWFFTKVLPGLAKKNPMPDWLDVPSPLIDVPNAQIGDACGQEPWRHRREICEKCLKKCFKGETGTWGGLYKFHCVTSPNALAHCMVCSMPGDSCAFSYSTLPGNEQRKNTSSMLGRWFFAFEGPQEHLCSSKNAVHFQGG